MKITQFYNLNLVVIVLTIAINVQVRGDTDESPASAPAAATDQQPLEEPKPTKPTESNVTVDTNSTLPLGPKAAHGSNFANYLESCEPPRLPCNPLKELLCDNNICKCNSNAHDVDHRRVYGTTTGMCLPIPNPSNGFACTDDSQCRGSSYGNFSRCNRTTGSDFNVCECYDTTSSHNQRKEVVLYKNVCYIKKVFGETCKTHVECAASLPDQAVCLGLSETENKSGVCKCAERYHYNATLTKCLKIGTINSKCETHEQCTHEEGLGPLSRCRHDTQTCTCWDVKGNNQKKTGFSGGRCHYSRDANETCTEKVECELGYHQDADCMAHESYNNEKICQCPPDRTCGDAASTFTASLIIIVLSIAYYISSR